MEGQPIRTRWHGEYSALRWTLLLPNVFLRTDKDIFLTPAPNLEIYLCTAPVCSTIEWGWKKFFLLGDLTNLFSAVFRLKYWSGSVVKAAMCAMSAWSTKIVPLPRIFSFQNFAVLRKFRKSSSSKMLVITWLLLCTHSCQAQSRVKRIIHLSEI